MIGRLSALLLVAVSTSPQSVADDCYESIIVKPSPFNGNSGEIIVLDDGTIWEEVSYQYLYLYEYHPPVLICPSRGILQLDEHRFEVVAVGRREPPVKPTRPAPPANPAPVTPPKRPYQQRR